MPFAAAFRQFHAAPRIAFAKAGKQARYVAAFGHVERDLVARPRHFGCKKNRLDQAKIVVQHQARLNINGWKEVSCCKAQRRTSCREKVCRSCDTTSVSHSNN